MYTTKEKQRLQQKMERLEELQELETILNRVDGLAPFMNSILLYDHKPYITSSGRTELVSFKINSPKDMLGLIETFGGLSPCYRYRYENDMYSPIFAPIWHKVPQLTQDKVSEKELHIEYSFCVQDGVIVLETFTFFCASLGYFLQVHAALMGRSNIVVSRYSHRTGGKTYEEVVLKNGLSLRREKQKLSTTFNYHLTMQELKDLLGETK